MCIRDSITIAPWGDVIVCEDGKGSDRIIGVKENGSTYVIAENILNKSEFAGVNFSPDGKILFVNIYSPTMTIAITTTIILNTRILTSLTRFTHQDVVGKDYPMPLKKSVKSSMARHCITYPTHLSALRVLWLSMTM